MESTRILIICKTFFQLIMAIRLNETLFKHDDVSVVLTDHSPNTKDLSKKLESKKIFKNVYFAKTKAYCGKKTKITEKLIDTIDIVKGNNRFEEITSLHYDKLLYYNLDLSILVIFARLWKKNKKLTCSRFEEGILSYNDLGVKIQKFELGYKMRKLLGFANILRLTKEFYCCYPEAYRGNLKAIPIPKMSTNDKIGELMSELFAISKEKLNYQEKYIYFSSVYDFEGGEPIGELETVKRIADVVGKDNLLIKKHPRDCRDVWEKEGFHIDKNSDIPWEAIQLNLDCSDKVFITANSGSVLSVNILLNPMPKTFFVYPCCNLSRNPQAQNLIRNIEDLLRDSSLKSALSNVTVVETIEEIKAHEPFLL